MPSVDEAATALGLTPQRVRTLARRGAFFGAYKRPNVLGGWVIPTSALRIYLAQRDSGRTPPNDAPHSLDDLLDEVEG